MSDHISDASDPAAPASGRSVPPMNVAFPMAHVLGSPLSPPTPCDCESDTRRIIGNLTQQPSHPSAPSPPAPVSAPASMKGPSSSLSSPLSGTLKTAHALVQQWGNVNGCPNAESHMDAPMLRSVWDAVDVVLRDHEVVVESMSSRKRRHSTHNPSTGPGQKEDAVAVMPRALIGELELESLEQAIVVQESIKHSILRLAAVLQDIEEEAALATRGQVESPLRDRGVNELNTRLFRLLRTVDQIAHTGNPG